MRFIYVFWDADVIRLHYDTNLVATFDNGGLILFLFLNLSYFYFPFNLISKGKRVRNSPIDEEPTKKCAKTKSTPVLSLSKFSLQN